MLKDVCVPSGGGQWRASACQGSVGHNSLNEHGQVNALTVLRGKKSDLPGVGRLSRPGLVAGAISAPKNFGRVMDAPLAPLDPKAFRKVAVSAKQIACLQKNG